MGQKIINICQGCISSPCLFNLCAECIMQNVRLDEAQAGINISRRNINNPRNTDDTTFMVESEEELKSFDESKAGFNLNTQNTKTMASDPITSWQIDGETVETDRFFFSWAPKSLQMVTATMKLKDACSLEGKS